MMTRSTDQPKSYAVLATLLASIFGFALLVVQNADLNNQISTFQNQLDAVRIGYDALEPKRALHVRTNGRRLEKVNAFDGESILEGSGKLVRRARELGSSKGSSSKGTKKSSKKSSSTKKSSSRDCSSSRTNDSASESTSADASGSSDSTSQARCEDLRQLVFDLSTEIEDLEGETLRFNALADELEQTALFAGGNPSENGRARKLQTDFEYSGQLEDSLRMLRNQQTLLKNGNERVSDLNDNLRKSALEWLGLNADLSDENLALLQNITFLSQENFELLNAQTRLSEQISSLNATLDTYKNLLDNHSDLNGELNQTTLFLEAEIDRLVAANEDYKKLNEALNETITDLSDQNTELSEQNMILEGLNKDLNASIDRLDEQVIDLSSEIDRLENQNLQLTSEVNRLEEATDELGQVNDNLEEQVSGLQDEVTQFSGKVDELQKFNDELQNIVSFVNETSSFLDETMDSVTEYLSEQIVAYRSVATETLQNTFIQRAALWDCAYRDHFGDDVFASNDKLPIPNSKFDEVLNYVDDRVLGELCLSLDDFEDFLELKFDDPVYTTNHIVSGIASYAYLAFDYYFPDPGETGGLSENDWAMAGYNCQRLPNSKRFRHNGNI